MLLRTFQNIPWRSACYQWLYSKRTYHNTYTNNIRICYSFVLNPAGLWGHRSRLLHIKASYGSRTPDPERQILRIRIVSIVRSLIDQLETLVSRRQSGSEWINRSCLDPVWFLAIMNHYAYNNGDYVCWSSFRIDLILNPDLIRWSVGLDFHVVGLWMVGPYSSNCVTNVC